MIQRAEPSSPPLRYVSSERTASPGTRVGGADAAPSRVGLTAVLAFAAPCVVAWTAWLLAFFPGLMTPDSTDQWMQAATGHLNDAHPVFHTFLLRVVRRLLDTPALVAVVQIAALALLVGAGLAVMLRAGAPRVACWVASLAFAVEPVMATMVIAVWKDVPFAISVFAIVILLNAVATDRRVLRRRWFWVAFVAANAGALLFRHNGLPAVIGACAAVLLLSRADWWRAAIALVVAIAVAQGARAAIFRRYDVPPPMGWNGITLLGLLAAHVSAQTPLREDERRLLADIRPLEDGWVYNCQSTVPTLFDGRLRFAALAAHDREIPALAARLALRAPRVTLAYEVCRTSLLWKVPQGRDLMSGPALWVEPNLHVTSIYPSPGAPSPHSLLPGLQRKLARVLRMTLSPPAGDGSLSWAFWRPALPLYALLVAGALFARLRRSWAPFVVLLPIVLHTVGLALSIPAPDVRYQYPVFLAATLLVPTWIGAWAWAAASERRRVAYA